MALFTIWESDTFGITLKRGSGPPRFNTEHVEEGAVKVLEFHAGTWAEACQREYDFYGWGKYRDHGLWDDIGPGEP